MKNSLLKHLASLTIFLFCALPTFTQETIILDPGQLIPADTGYYIGGVFKDKNDDGIPEFYDGCDDEYGDMNHNESGSQQGFTYNKSMIMPTCWPKGAVENHELAEIDHPEGYIQLTKTKYVDTDSAIKGYIITPPVINLTSLTLEISPDVSSTPERHIYYWIEYSKDGGNTWEPEYILDETLSNFGDMHTYNESSLEFHKMITASQEGPIVMRIMTKPQIEVGGAIEYQSQRLKIHWLSIIADLPEPVPLDSIDVFSLSGSGEISENNGHLQLATNYFPENASYRSVTWTVSNDSIAIINQSGLLSAESNGIVWVIAKSNSDTTISDSIQILISNQLPEAIAINIYSENNQTSIDTNNGQLQLYVSLTPENADDSVIWTILETELASINNNGLVTAKQDGNIHVVTFSNIDNSLTDTFLIEISNQIIELEDLEISFNKDTNIVDINSGSIQFSTTFIPENTSQKDVIYTVSDISIAKTSKTGLFKPLKNGSVWVKVTSSINSEIADSVEIFIEGDLVNTQPLTEKINIYPNPVNQILHFNQIVNRAELIDIDGKTIKTVSLVDFINVADVKSGLYWLRIFINSKYSIQTILIE